MARRVPSPDLPAALARALDPPDPAAITPDWEDRVLSATSSLLGQRGWRGWTVDDVAVLSGVGRATLYRHYASRDGLVQATVTRDARTFFAVVAASVGRPLPTDPDPDRLAGLVTDGLAIGLSMARSSPFGELIRRDPATAVGLLTSSALLATAATALVDTYQGLLTTPLDRAGRARLEARAEVLVRLALSFLLVPDRPSDTPDAAARRLYDMVAPLLLM